MEPVYYCSESEYQRMNREAQMHLLHSMEEAADISAVLKKNCCPTKGIVFPMSDNGKYSGSIYFMGIDPVILDEKDNYDILWEIGTIIQNRIKIYVSENS